ncbi:endonuclease/exonuclease/phosphatase family protein [Plasticicumulans sp.]|uniref:endonuclease/exonuclease/phosphatase family protein n=1 Tax=Plasticicumulans sp. TaxID=2307179 RepID=UPI000FAD6E4C|nr:endonuclease/exonuclease/phosphatase family protein [Plasticicumulans sp.]MBS0600613.1 endonuclease/exonuclease/phosphatase family protein [Pseudomonadota bacterium]RTK96003.1 MAG: EEP domain-containing protein [Xanthomonadales bacterium]HMV38613.1 endonuclease/exonuclease/phosphatase family protein [Plasticicumulans sp.]HMW29160.1 endonuclease/exonuclease/phosphatase family protein [Plasticicumulans sp.]HMW43108.1 endonuclease/exonuclease/phosphatase family protein [Plasticicumulans sp.]
MERATEPALQRLRLLSYNIQSGLSTRRYSDYVTHSWRHVLPVPSRMVNLDAIADLAAGYDIVGLQEVDPGSLRSGFVDQAAYLAARGGFPFVHDQSNRRIGMISHHANAVLSRHRPSAIEDRKLPGLIKGRGVLCVRYGDGPEALHLFIIHLALGRRGRMQQLGFLAELIADARHAIVMGDLNCHAGSPEIAHLLARTSLAEPEALHLPTFPSWAPNRQLDHILVSESIRVERVEVLRHTYSDHLPIAMEVVLPAAAWWSGIAPAAAASLP